MISDEDVKSSVKSLSANKACGLDNLFAEHILYANPSIHALLSICFNAFIVHGFLPSDLTDTVLVPIVNTLTAKDGDLRLSASNACLPKTEISVFVTECVFFTSTCYKLHDVLYS